MSNLSPIGSSYFSHVLKPHSYKGESVNTSAADKFEISVLFSEDDKDKILNEARACWEKYEAENFDDSAKAQINRDGYKAPISVINDKLYIRFKASESAEVTDEKNGEKHVIHFKIKLFDSMLNECREAIEKHGEIGNGSTVRVNYDYIPYYYDKDRYGVSLRLKAVQIISLAPAEANGANYGFEKVPNGFVGSDK